MCCVVVFLGGSCNPTTWRSDIAIPFFKRHNITYYNPVGDLITPLYRTVFHSNSVHPVYVPLLIVWCRHCAVLLGVVGGNSLAKL